MAGLRRHLGLFSTTMYGVGIILGAGIYVLVGSAAGSAGNAVWLSFLIGSAVAALSGLSYAELSSLYPRSAAELVFVKNAFRSNFLGSTVGWMTVFVSIISAATVALGFGGYAAEFVHIPIVVPALLLVGALSILNFAGIRESSRMNIVFTLVEAAGLGLVIYLGFSSAGHAVNYLEMPNGLNGVLLGFVLIFFAFIGFEDMVNIAEETANPRRTLPRAILFSILITGVIYILVSLSAVRLVGWGELGQSTAPLADVAGKALGLNGKVLMSGLALFATTNTVLIILLSGSRMIYGLASHGSLPKVFAKIHHRTKTPWVSVIAMMAAASCFVLVGRIVTVANITVFVLVVVYSMVNMSVILLRLREPGAERPFRIPLNVGNFPILPALGLASTLFMLTRFDLDVMLAGLGLIGIAAFLFVFTKPQAGTAPGTGA